MSDYRYALTRTTAPTLEPLTLAETKLYLRLDSSDEDTLVTRLTQAARDAAEAYLRHSLMPQQWRIAADDYFLEEVRLPMGPVTSIIRVASYDAVGTQTILATTRYQLNAAKTALLISGGLYAPTVEIVYATGYSSAELVPAAIRQGMLQHIAAMYSARAEGPVPVSSLQLYAVFRELRL